MEDIDLHDAVLENIIVNWEAQTVILRLGEFGTRKKIDITAHDFTNLSVPRDNPWGDSKSINNTTSPKLQENGNYLYTIEMQSGDVIEIEAKSFEVKKESAPVT